MTFQVRNYLITLGCVAVALIICLVLQAAVHPNYFHVFLGAVVISAFYGGIRAGLIATFLAALLVNYIFTPPAFTFVLNHTVLINLMMFISVSLVVNISYEITRRSKQNAESRQEELWVILQSIGDGVIVTNTDRQVVFMNAAAERLTGWMRADAEGLEIQKVFRIVHPNSGEIVETPTGLMFNDGHFTGDPITMITKDGKEHVIDESAAPVRAKNGKITGMVLAFRDVSERYRFENALKESEIRFRLLFDNAPIGIALSRQDKLIYVNSTYSRLYGFSNKMELIGTPPLERFAPEVRSEMDEILQKRNRNEPIPPQIETIAIRKDGSAFPKLLMLGRFMISDAPTGFAFVQDISQAKAAEAALRESEARFRMMADHAPVLIWMTDTDKSSLFFNRGWLEFTGRTLEQELGFGWLENLHPDDFERCRELYNDAFEKQQPVVIECRLRRHDGQYRWILNHGVPRFELDGKFVGFTGSCMDITERKTAEERSHLLQRLTAAFSEATTVESVAEVIVQEGLRGLGGTIGAVCLVTNDGKSLEMINRHGISEESYQSYRMTSLDFSAPLNDAVRAGEPVWIENQADYIARYPHFATAIQRNGTHSTVCLPIYKGGEMIGGISFGFPFELRLTQIDQTFFASLAEQFAQALERVRLAQETKDARERFEITLASIGDAVIATDTQGTIVFMNPVAERLTGWSRYEATGKPLEEIFCIQNELTGELLDNPYDKVMQFGTMVGLANHTILVKRDGQMLPIEDNGAPIRNVQGEVVGVVVVFRDISERRKAEITLAKNFSRTKELYEISRQINMGSTIPEIFQAIKTGLHDVTQISVMIFNKAWDEVSPESYELVASLRPAFPFQSKLGEKFPLSFHPLSRLFARNELTFVENFQQDSRLNEDEKRRISVMDAQSAILCPLLSGGEWFGMLNLYSPLSRGWTQDEVLYVRSLVDQFAVAVQNIRRFNAEQKARQEAEEANALKLKFLGMISHELRTPLTSIKGFATTLLANDVVYPETQQREFLGVIDQEADKLKELIDQLLDLSRIQANSLPIVPKRQPLTNVFEIARVQLATLTRQHRLVLNIPDHLPLLNIDAPRIAQVLVNLIGNAAKFSPIESLIIVTVHQFDGCVQIDVKDQGSGIPVEAHAYVFEAFRQVESSGKIRKGAGLGLAICKGLVESHRGRIWIQQMHESGTTISFTLPIEE